MEGLVRETEGLVSPQQREWGEREGDLPLYNLHGSQHLETVSNPRFVLPSQPFTLNPAN